MLSFASYHIPSILYRNLISYALYHKLLNNIFFKFAINWEEINSPNDYIGSYWINRKLANLVTLIRCEIREKNKQ